MDINAPKFRDDFINFSVVVTGFSEFHLKGTDLANLYFENIRDIIGGDLFGELLETFDRLYPKNQENKNESILTNRLRSEILGSEKLGPIARNIIKLWYVATWYQLPQSWRDIYGTKEKDRTFIISPQAYQEGLLWPAIGVNPPGAKPPGYGTWSEPPLVSISRG